MGDIFEIYGTGVHNVGAMLMATEIADRLRQKYPTCSIVVGAGFGNAQARNRLAFDLIDDVPGRAAGPYLRYMPKSLRSVLGVTKAESVHAVFDASGFAYSDAFGATPGDYLFRKMTRKHRMGQKLILLPQAIGPFNDPSTAESCRKLLKRADLIFSRDADSQHFANSLLGFNKAELCADVTISIEPHFQFPDEWGVGNRYVAVVPNFRMLRRHDDPGGKGYLAIMRMLFSKLDSVGIPIRVVLHSLEEDVALANELAELSSRAQIVKHHDPRILKGFLGQSYFVIGSRFHALVSALSQGVPCMGLGWSHKYQWLFKDFGIDEYLIPIEKQTAVFSQLDALIDGGTNASLRLVINNKADVLKAQVDCMWNKVFEFLDDSGCG